MKTYLTCRCGNPKSINDLNQCQCGLYLRKVTNCDICGYEHKVRSPEFCRSLHSTGLKDLNEALFLQESMELRQC